MQRPAPLLASVLFSCLALLLTSCGAGGCGDSGAAIPGGGSQTTLAITTSRLPDGQVEGAYPPTQLVAAGAQAPLQWMLTAGQLPPGVDLSAGGIVSGRPGTEGLFTFSVATTDGVGTDSRALVLAVDTFGLSIAGLHFGEAWGTEAVTFEAVGTSGSIAFEIVTNGSGGAFDFIDEEGGRAVWVPGDTGSACCDRIRAVDSAGGGTTEVDLYVMPHPAPYLVAEFGGSDVWFVNDSHRFGNHALPRDWDEALRLLGLRSSTFIPTVVDDMAGFYVRTRVLSALNVFFGRNPDGTCGAGLPISFPLARPPVLYSAPAPGTWAGGAPDCYNVISVLHGSNPSVMGLAFVDNASNALIENDTTTGNMGEMGVFTNQVARAFNAAFQNNALPADPIGPEDEAILRDLIHGRQTSGPRAYLIQRAADNFAQVTAMILAHEIGHSLGLGHTSPVVSGSIMNGGIAVYPGAGYAFVPADMNRLRAALPGPGRQYGSAKPSHVPALPAGGIEACVLHLEPSPCPCSCSAHD